MPPHSPELIETYALEIIARAQAIQGKCKVLLSRDFASESPKTVGHALVKMCDYLEKATKKFLLLLIGLVLMKKKKFIFYS